MGVPMKHDEAHFTGVGDGPLEEFRRRLLDVWLPEYAHDPRRQYGVEGFRPTYRLDAFDAEWFMTGLDSGLVRSDHGGRLRAPRSKVQEVIFWECGPKAVRPRPINLALEPIITVATLARLHVQYGWPAGRLGMQSKDWAFDLVAYREDDGDTMAVAGEIKRTRREVDKLIEFMAVACRDGETDAEPADSRAVNAYRKWQALGRCQAPLFWAVGPGGLGRLFAIDYRGGVAVSMNEIAEDALRFTASVGA